MSSLTSRIFFFVLLGGSWAVACGRRGRSELSVGSTAAPASAISAAPPGHASQSSAPANGEQSCESLMQRGAVFLRVPTADAASALARGERLPDGAVLEVPESAEITIRTAHYREITITGPATAAVCPNGEDAVLLSRGRVSAFPGTGVRPGAEVWVATPVGVVRYSDAKIDIDATSPGGNRIRASAAMAQAEFVAAPGTRVRRMNDDDPVPTTPFEEVLLAAGATLIAERSASAPGRVVPELVHACTKESAAAEEAARRLAADAADAGELGERASAHVRARRRARAACEMARAAAGQTPGALDGSLVAELAAADEKRNRLTPLPARR